MECFEATLASFPTFLQACTEALCKRWTRDSHSIRAKKERMSTPALSGRIAGCPWSFINIVCRFRCVLQIEAISVLQLEPKVGNSVCCKLSPLCVANWAPDRHGRKMDPPASASSAPVARLLAVLAAPQSSSSSSSSDGSSDYSSEEDNSQKWTSH